MKKILGIIFILTLTFTANAQKLNTSQDSISVFYDKLFSVMQKEYLYKKDVNWKNIELTVQQNLRQYSDFKSSLKEVTTLFDFAKAHHCRVYYNDAHFSSTNDGPTEKDFSAQWLKKYATEPVFEVKVLDNEFGYILMPSMTSEENLHEQSQLMYDEINAVKNLRDLKGWIIDLRFNPGGDIWPMLLALYDFLGDTDVWGEMDINKKQTIKIKFKNGKYKSNSKTISYINPKGELLDKTKVAVITNIATASSGEITALAFKGRENTIFIGEKTNGMTTTNHRRSLSFGAYMTLTMGYDCDRNGKFYKQITPDITIIKQDNFDDLLLDKNIEEAIKFISGID